MMRLPSLTLVACFLCAGAVRAAEEGLVAAWGFTEGSGAVLHDGSGNGNDGVIHRARWVTSGKVRALQFSGNDYVDCGAGKSLDITGPVTLSVWVYPTSVSAKEPGIAGKFFESYALTYYRGGCWWYTSSGGNGVSAGVGTGQWHHVVGVFDGQTMRLFLDGEQVNSQKSKFPAVRSGPQHFTIGCIFGDPKASDEALRNTAFFEGMVADVKVYNRALALPEVLREYNRRATEMGRTPFDESWIGRCRLTPYHYPSEGRLIVEADYRGLLPIPKGAEIQASLLRRGDANPVQSLKITPNADVPSAEVAFDLKPLGELPAGTYLVQAALPGKESSEIVAFQNPPAPVFLPAPEAKQAAPLPPPLPPVKYGFSLKPGGGFSVAVRGVEYPIESAYSFPNGGDNRLVAGETPDRRGEAAWAVRTQTAEGTTRKISASGQFYSIERAISLLDDRVLVKDAITNKSPDVLGIILENSVRPPAGAVRSVELPHNNTLFAVAEDHGLGMIALDDVYQLQQDCYYRDGVAAIFTNKFGLDKGASYTVEWAVYPTMTADYFDFINAVRRDEGLTGRTIEGSWSGIDLRPSEILSAEKLRVVVEAKRIRYGCIGYDWRPAEDRGISLEGIEFHYQYRSEADRLQKAIADLRGRFPEMKVMFHIAHGLYMTGEPEKLFPDSRVMDSNGTQLIYGPNSLDYYGRYVSKERFAQGYRWWIFYPTMENSFGKAMLAAMDYMVNTMKANAMWGDGYFCGYARGYAYNAWDGHSVEIDPKTKTVARKMGNVTLMALPVLKEVCRKIEKGGGILLTNDTPGPRSFWKEHYISTCETGGSDQQPVAALHLGPTVVALGDPSRISSPKTFYADILNKLDWGALYFFYGDRGYGDKGSLVTYMYPMTATDIHSGWVRGVERIVTKKPGVYGWRGDRALHRVVRCDARGALVPNGDFGTADASGVRTQLNLKPMESAVVIRLPVRIECDQPVNFLVEKLDADECVVRLNGKGAARLVAEGPSAGKLAGAEVRVTLSGETQVRIAPAKP